MSAQKRSLQKKSIHYYTVGENIPDTLEPEKFELKKSHFLDKEISVEDSEKIQAAFISLFAVEAEKNIYDSYISECSEVLGHILSDSSNYEIVGKTGAGKTRGLLEKALSVSGLKLVFLVPLRANAIQVEKNPVYEGKIKAIYDEVKEAKTREYVRDCNVIVSTYNGLSKLIAAGLRPSDYVLVIDEYHNLVTQSNFRAKTIREIAETESRFKKIIRITGTPGLIMCKYPNKGWRRVSFIGRHKTSNIKKYSIISYGKDGVSKVAAHIAESNYPNKVIVLIQSKKSLDKLKQILNTKGISDRISIITRCTKKSEDYMSIASPQKIILPQTKILLTTSVISDGIDILNTDIDAIYTLDIDDPILLRQFAARFRKASADFYDFIAGSSEGTIVIPSVDKTILLRGRFLERIAKLFKKFYGAQAKGMTPTEWFEKTLGTELSKESPIYLTQDNKIEIDRYMIQHQELKKMHRSTVSHPRVRKEFMKLCEGWDAELVDNAPIVSLSRERQKKELLKFVKDHHTAIYESVRKTKDLRKLKRTLHRLSLLRDEGKSETMKLLRRLNMENEHKAGLLVSKMLRLGTVFHSEDLYNRFCILHGSYWKDKLKQNKFVSVVKDVFLTKKSSKPVTLANKEISRENNTEVIRKRRYCLNEILDSKS